MAFELPALPYSNDALEPNISAETIGFHYGKHHQGYVTKLNAATEGTPFADWSLEDLITKPEGKPFFNNAAQIWNHTFYWNCLSPNGGGEPTGDLAAAITKNFGSFGKFKAAFSGAAATHFGSGWAWLVKNSDGSLAIVGGHDAGNPLTNGQTPLLTLDVWEHAYYVDYRNGRATYIENFWNIVNWDFVAGNL